MHVKENASQKGTRDRTNSRKENLEGKKSLLFFFLNIRGHNQARLKATARVIARSRHVNNPIR